MCNCKVILISVGVLGAVLLILGAVLGFAVIPPIIEDEITAQVRLEQGTEQYDRWEVTPMPFNFKVYIFDVQNVDEIMMGEKPIVKQVGPYIYTMKRKKLDVTYAQEADTYKYVQHSTLVFDEKASAPLSDDDLVTVLNVPLQGAFQKSEDAYGDIVGLNAAWGGMFEDTTTLFHTLKVKELLLDGYKFCRPDANDAVKLACDKVKQLGLETITEEDGYAVFAFFKHKHNMEDGPYVINGGNEDVNRVGAIQEWKGQTLLEEWGDQNDNRCIKIRGRDSSIYPPFNNDSSAFDVFNTDICRIVTLRTKYRSSYKDIDGYVATLDEDTLTNEGFGECYCTLGIKNLEGVEACLPKGFGDLSSCTGAAIIMSFPHFLYADPEYSDTVEGLEPDEDLHKTFVMIEPGTGSPLQGAKRMQFNMIIRPIKKIKVSENVARAMLPILWVEEGVELTDELVQKLKDDYLSKLVMVDAITYTLIGLGVVLFVVGFGAYLFKRCC